MIKEIIVFSWLIFLSALILPGNTMSSDKVQNVYEVHTVMPGFTSVFLCPYKGYMQERINYACEISRDKDFIFTIESENHAWTVDMVGITNDLGICQVSPYWHPSVVNHPEWSDWRHQIRECWRLYSGGTRFYGYDVRGKVKDRFIY